MRYTPVELRHVKLTRARFRGYKRAEADQLIEDVAESFEDVWRERGELADNFEDLEKRFDEVKQREALLTSTLVAAEKTAAAAIEALSPFRDGRERRALTDAAAFAGDRSF